MLHSLICETGYRRLVGALGLMLLATVPTQAADDWIELTADKEFAAWKGPFGTWKLASGVSVDGKNPKLLAATAGEGLIVNGPNGRGAPDLVTKQRFADVEVHVEFLISKGSNSGVKLQGLYEIQIYDSFGVKELTGNDCGGIYPRAEQKPNYHHIDKGTPPKVNACKPAGEWQTLDIVFQAPRFEGGKKVRNARFVKVTLNDKLIHDNVDVEYPTGHAWHNPEVATGPLLLQGDHGPVAFRNVRIRPFGTK